MLTFGASFVNDGSPSGVVAKILAAVNEFELQSRTNTLRKGMNRFSLLAIGLNDSLLLFYKDGFGIK